MLHPQKATTSEFSLAQARAIIHDLFKPNPVIYWTDFLVSIFIGNACFAAVRLIWELGPGGFMTKLAISAGPFIVCGLLFFRAVLFIHELTHLKTGEFRAFRIMWNLLCGIPFLTPSFVYYPHVDHHRRKHFGTQRDGEYISLGHQPPRNIVLFLALSFIIPVLAAFRFLVLTPLTWFIPPLRRWVGAHASSMVMDPSYLRPLPTDKVVWTIRLQELGCFLWLVAIIVAARVIHDRLPYPFMIQAYCTGVFIVTLNAIRTLGSHRWWNKGEEMTFLEQYLDSMNFPHRPFVTELWGPIGTRYHALHHLFPTLPYHAMPEAHRRLMRELPEDSLYRETEEVTLVSTLADLWRRAKANTKGSATTSESNAA